MSRVLTFLVFFGIGNFGFGYLAEEFEIRGSDVPADYVFSPNEFASQGELELFESLNSTTDMLASRSVYEQLSRLNNQKPFYEQKLDELDQAQYVAGSFTQDEASKMLKSVEMMLDTAIVRNMNPMNLVRSKYESEYRHLASGLKYNLLPVQDVYLYYDGLASGSIWDKPGATAFGANLVSTISFSGGPLLAKVIAHVGLEGDRNYFYVVTESGEGWMGRPYIRRDREGSEFLMPNPITGESMQAELNIPLESLVSEFRTAPARYVPSYNSIQWDSRIPEQFRREGYSMYVDALNDGYTKVDSLVRQYQSTYAGGW